MARFEVYKSTSKDGGFRWRLTTMNGEIVAIGQRYSTKAGCRKGIESIKKTAAKAEVVDS
jgi:uncharacterized protein YegP (UPF0339 family)